MRHGSSSTPCQQTTDSPIVGTPADPQAGDSGGWSAGDARRVGERRRQDTPRPGDQILNEPVASGVGVAPATISAGTYEATGEGWSRFTAHNCGKLAIEFAVAVPDPDASYGIRLVTLPRYYNVNWKARDRFEVGSHSDYMREWMVVTGRRPTRKDRLAPSRFKGVRVEVEVRIVTRDGRQRPLPKIVHYSVIGRILRVVAGGHVPR